MRELNFESEYTTEKGMVYCSFIGNNEKTPQSLIKDTAKDIESLKGQVAKINGKKVRIIDSRVSGRCNLINTNYYIEILTDYGSMGEWLNPGVC